MTVRLSTGLKNGWLGGQGGGHLLNMLANGVARVYSGAQPSSADDAETGTLLLEISNAAGAFTGATAATAELTLDGASGTLDTVKVGGSDENLLAAAVTYASSLTNTAALVAASINGKRNSLGITATANSPANGDVLLSCPAWMGALANNLAVTTTSTTLTVDINNAGSPGTSEAGVFTGGVTAANGINFDMPAAAGVISKESGETWSDAGLATGTAGYLRFYDCTKTLGASETAVRLDMSVGTVGADAIMSNTNVVTGVTSSIVSATLRL